jgi:hypothetical protein
VGKDKSKGMGKARGGQQGMFDARFIVNGTMWNFTFLGLPFSKYLAILAKSPQNKIPGKFYLLRNFPKKSISSGLGIDSELVRNPAMCLVHNQMAPYKHKAEIPLVSMDDAKSCHEQFQPVSACHSQYHVAMSMPSASLFS